MLIVASSKAVGEVKCPFSSHGSGIVTVQQSFHAIIQSISLIYTSWSRFYQYDLPKTNKTWDITQFSKKKKVPLFECKNDHRNAVTWLQMQEMDFTVFYFMEWKKNDEQRVRFTVLRRLMKDRWLLWKVSLMTESSIRRLTRPKQSGQGSWSMVRQRKKLTYRR